MKKTVNDIFIPKIAGKKTVLRLIKKMDLKKSLMWLKDTSVNMYLSHNFRDYTEEQELKWFDFINKSNNDIVFAIEDKNNNLYIGNCALHKIQWDKKTCELGIFIGEKDYWNKGYGSDAVKSISKFAFNRLNLKKIVLDVYRYNRRAIKVYKKCGFMLTKIERKNHFYDGKYWDTLLMELRKSRTG
ncbi:MAG: GNAT family protein [Actinomycetota bacterium]|nr:GNAT family protein [Actinomycetota bacterium]